MAEKFYTSEVNKQILIQLLKAHNIHKVIASPGATNITFIGSIQNDPWFEIYSSVDERSAAYMACGMAAESGEPVVLTCTGATASRNYIPGLTEAFYRKLPVLAVTASQHFGRAGQYIPQMLDRSRPPIDCVKMNVNIPMIHTDEDRQLYTVKMNDAILELRHSGGGPVLINIVTEYSPDFSVHELPPVKVINRIEPEDEMPPIKAGTVGIFIGAHPAMSERLTGLIDSFCEKYNGAVLCSHISNYRGKYEIHPNLVPLSPRQGMDLMIYIGTTEGAYTSLRPSEVWQVNPDGVVRDRFGKLRYVFQMSDEEFFSRYVNMPTRGGGVNCSYYTAWRNDYDYVRARVPELPFSNAWIAQNTIDKLPANSVLHLGVSNTRRCWNMFELPKTVNGYCNTGCCGIDGCISSLIGASLASPGKLFFGVTGDLTFFYDMNSIGNRHVGKNLRIMIINNGIGAEFKLYTHPAASFGDDADRFMAARGHFGQQSRDLVRHYAQDLGFEYMTAANKEEYLANVIRFTTPETLDRPMLFEVFTNPKDESDALYAINNIDVTDILPPSMRAKNLAKQTVKSVLGSDGVKTLKKIIGRQ
ncbi:MAG: hypothetical protein IKQ95_08660 [Synergistaceae bacterium]|nr:hypothetical protein [Synergistaceae bacterium]